MMTEFEDELRRRLQKAVPEDAQLFDLSRPTGSSSNTKNSLAVYVLAVLVVALGSGFFAWAIKPHSDLRSGTPTFGQSLPPESKTAPDPSIDPDNSSSATVLISNTTSRRIWIVTAYDSRADVAAGADLTYVGCDVLPLRAESMDFEPIAYFDECGATDTWVIHNTQPPSDMGSNEVGTVKGSVRVQAEAGNASEAVAKGTVVFRGPVTATASLRRDGSFKIELPSGTYDVQAVTAVLKKDASVTHCPLSEPIAVSEKSSLIVELACRSS